MWNTWIRQCKVSGPQGWQVLVDSTVPKINAWEPIAWLHPALKSPPDTAAHSGKVSSPQKMKWGDRSELGEGLRRWRFGWVTIKSMLAKVSLGPYGWPATHTHTQTFYGSYSPCAPWSVTYVNVFFPAITYFRHWMSLWDFAEYTQQYSTAFSVNLLSAWTSGLAACW